MCCLSNETMKHFDQSYSLFVLVLYLFVHSVSTDDAKYRTNTKYFKSFRDVEIIKNNHSIRKYDNLTTAALHLNNNANQNSSNAAQHINFYINNGIEFKNMSGTNTTGEDNNNSNPNNLTMTDIKDDAHKCKCNCSCGSNREEAVNFYTLHYTDDDDGHEDDDHTDDIDDLEKIQNPNNFIPHETIELSHRPDNLLKPSTTTSRPHNTLYSSLLPSSLLYSKPSKPATKPVNTSLSSMGTYTQIGLTVMLSLLMMSVMIPYAGTARHEFGRNERREFRRRQNKPNNNNNDYNLSMNYDPLLVIDELLQQLNIKYN